MAITHEYLESIIHAGDRFRQYYAHWKDEAEKIDTTNPTAMQDFVLEIASAPGYLEDQVLLVKEKDKLRRSKRLTLRKREKRTIKRLLDNDCTTDNEE